MARRQGAVARHPRARARGRPPHPRGDQPAQPDVRDAVRPRRHVPPRLRDRRRLRPRRRGRRQHRCLRGAQRPAEGAAAGRSDPSRRLAFARGRRAVGRLQRLVATARRAARARGRGRPAIARGRRRAVPLRRRPIDDHPLEGHPRAARGGRRRLRERRGRARGDPRQEPLTLLVVTIAVALAFDFTNGFHDTANAVATSVSTRALSPRLAVLIAALANLGGAFATTAVAKTVGKGIIDSGLATEKTVLAAVIGAIVWNLITWWLGLPSSSSHALIGGLVGAALAESGEHGVPWHGVAHQVVIPALWAAAIACAGGFLLLLAIFWSLQRLTPGIANRSFRLGQLASGPWVAFRHG